MRSRILTGAGICLLTLAALGIRTAARGQAAEPPPPKLIVLESGQVIEGAIRPDGAGFFVKAGGGEYLVPTRFVKLTATDRTDAYRKYRDLMPEPTPANHYYLARWCVAYGLNDEARNELKQALMLDPHHAEARSLLVQLTRAAGEMPRSNTPERSVAVRDRDGFRKTEERSACGLTPEAVGTYVSRIQPVLMNSCATVGCHHRNADNGLKLQYVRLSGRSNRLATEANLAAVLSMIDRSEPSKSPLLTMARDEHAGALRSLVRQPRGSEILELFDGWVRQAASDLNSLDDSSPGTDAAPPANKIVPVGGTRDDETARPNSHAATSVPRDPDDFVRKILRDSRPDPFDPAAFNRGRD